MQRAEGWIECRASMAIDLVLLYILSFAATASAIAWLFLLFHPARPWDFQPVGDDGDAPAGPANWPPVCILVPARNEAESLPQTLPALLKQDYPGEFRIFLMDDRSSDGTADVARKLAAELNAGERLTVLSGTPLPAGWVGKMWALDQAARTALKETRAEYVLLTDADIYHAPGSLRRLVAESSAGKLGLNSRMARLRCVSAAEKLLIPAFVYFFNLLYPMRRVNNPNDPLAAAAGGCVLLSRAALEALGGGFECVKNEIIDDVNVGRNVKARGFPIRLSLSRSEVVSLREYPVLADIWQMVRRTAFTELKYSAVRLLGAVAGLVLLFIVPPLALTVGLVVLSYVWNGGAAVLLMPGAWAALKGAVALAAMRVIYGPATAFFGLGEKHAWSLPIAGVLYGLMTVDSALQFWRGKGVRWREPGQM